MESKISILLLSSNTYPSVRNSKIQKKIFYNQKIKLKHIYWYKQGSPKILQNSEALLEDKNLYINADDSSTGMGMKTIKAFEWMINNTNSDYIFRTNTSSYVSIENLQKHINDNFLNKKYVYSGKIHSTKDKNNNEISFASGSGYLLNRKTIELIIEKQNEWQHEYWDDVSLGILLKKYNIFPTDAKRFDIKGNIYKQKVDLTSFHYRCRIDNYYKYPRFLEYYVLRYLNKIDLGKKSILIEDAFMNVLFEISRIFYIQQFTWKLYLIFRALSKKVFPKFLIDFMKVKFKKQLDSFKHKRFKT